jgi:DNA-binding LacI/PurR family transcriptional regulator
LISALTYNAKQQFYHYNALKTCIFTFLQLMRFVAATIKDIAKALNLSTSTVSRALRDSYEISPETKKLVRDYAEKVNYKPNPIALSLKEKRSRSIGVIVCEVANSYFSQVINGIESVAGDNGYNVIISQSHESFDREMLNLQYLTSRSIDGLIISVSADTKDFDYLKNLHEKGLPIVFFDRIVNEIDTHKVIADNFQGAYDATRHLVDCGYQRIAILSNSEILSIGRERHAGYSAALTEAGISTNQDLVKYCEYGGMMPEEVEAALTQLFSLEEKPDAVLAASDKLTTGCLRFFKKNNISVPDQVGLIGFSNLDLTELLSPSLSVIRQPAFEMGERAVKLLLNLIESKRPVKDFETVMLKTEMFLRESTKKMDKKGK